ncbi:MAG: HlyD family efflux transporter periplasmic adaptor subunit [Desulfobacteraceae bacterium]|nr:HlyD family efflux transporter periplasmic adaptor subunit [Desulfobacteraceae bacterium]
MQEFLKIWLRDQYQNLPGVQHALLLTGPADKGPFNQSFSWPDPTTDRKALSGVADASLKLKKPVIKTRYRLGENAQEPLDALACPLFLHGRLNGAVAMEIPHRSQSLQKEALKQMKIGAKWLETMVQAQNFTAKEQLINLVDLVASALEYENFHTAAMQVANELAQRFACHRVSLGFLNRSQIQIETISNSSQIDQHSNLTRAIRDCMNEALDQQATVVYPPSQDNPLLVTRLHALLAQQHKASSICSVPLVKNGKMTGVFLLERSTEKPFDAQTVEQLERIGLLLGPVLENRRREEQPLRIKLAGAITSRLNKFFGPRRLGLKVAGGLSVLLLLLLCIISAPFRISTDSILEANIRRSVIAAQIGFIASANVRAGDLVQKNDLLATLDNKDLLIQQRKWRSQSMQLLKEYRKALAGRNRSEVTILKAKRLQAEAQLNLVEQQLARTKLTAPIDGLVVKGDLSQSLGSPVERGQVLFEVAPIGEYRVILNVDDRDIGLIYNGLPGKLRLAGIPGQLIDIQIQRVPPVSFVEQGHNYFRVEAAMKHPFDLLRPGMKGVAKIEVGHKKLIRILTRRLTNWIRVFFWSHLP